jgi:hypothetical protein
MKVHCLIFLAAFSLLFSCRKPEDSPAPSSIIKGKRWKLVSYDLGGTEIVSSFSGCVLSFDNNDVLIITNAGTNHTGTWVEFSDPPKIDMIISSNDPYVNLFNKTWETVLLTPGRIQMADNKLNPLEVIKLDLLP